MKIPEPFKGTFISKNILEEYLFVGDFQDGNSPIYNYFPKDTNKKGAWAKVINEYNPSEILYLILFLFSKDHLDESKEEIWGMELISNKIKNEKVISVFAKRYAEPTFDLAPSSLFFIETSWYGPFAADNNNTIWSDNCSWVRNGIENIMLFEKNLNNEHSLFVKEDEYEIFISEITKIGKLLFK